MKIIEWIFPLHIKKENLVTFTYVLHELWKMNYTKLNLNNHEGWCFLICHFHKRSLVGRYFLNLVVSCSTVAFAFWKNKWRFVFLLVIVTWESTYYKFYFLRLTLDVSFEFYVDIKKKILIWMINYVSSIKTSLLKWINDWSE